MTNDRTQARDAETYMHADPVTDAALDWLLRLQSSPADDAERARFEQWRGQNPRHAETYSRLVKLGAMPELEAATQQLARQGGEILPFRAPARRRVGLWAGAIAATILLAVSIQQYPGLMIGWQADYHTATGSKQVLDLPDGSRMTLNTASAVALDFDNGRRSVRLLQGEAFFDVVPDAAHPFKVAGHFSEVEVKGTGFSVRTDDQQDLVVLQHGAVQVDHLPDRASTAHLDPGQSISATASSLSPVLSVSTENALAWLEGRIVFTERQLSSVLDEIGRYYPSPVIIANNRIGHMLVSGNYRLTDPEGTIRSLASAAGATVSRLPGGILILQ
ncbi:FecR family protein [Rhizobium sp. 18065]|uniref:FecR family protein n=1 Tax=Rhizobium sp. 18065 TaxID=2681411 RepID=UPI001FCE889E|nr:FecR family protein [Rhizobium sp. 18065]